MSTVNKFNLIKKTTKNDVKVLNVFAHINVPASLSLKIKITTIQCDITFPTSRFVFTLLKKRRNKKASVGLLQIKNKTTYF